MAAAAVEPPMSQLNHKFETMKIDAHRMSSEMPEVHFPVITQQVFPSFVGENFHSNASIASSEMIGDGASSYCSREDYSELAFVTAPNGYLSSHGNIYGGSPSPIMSSHGYVPYQMEGVHYYNPVVEYSYGNQPVFGSVPTSMHYSAHGNDAYVYAPQVYQYPVQPYYQQSPIGPYVPAAPTLPAGGMVMLEPQESGILAANNFNYAGPMAAALPPLTFVSPPISCENPALVVSYPAHPAHPAPHASHTLRASAPAWIEPGHDLRGNFKERKSVDVQVTPQLAGLCPSSKGVTSLPTNGVLSKSCATVKVVGGVHIPSGPASVPTHCTNDAKESACPGFDKPHKKEGVSLNSQVVCATETRVQETGMQPKGQPYVLGTKPVKLLTAVPNKVACPCLPNGERYNTEDFVTKYDDAKHFIIKSYSEENVYRSIQYGVWASTPNGNKKLDDAYHDAQRRATGRPRGCPVFLFFSVNGSRQFCGVAEMIGPVDYKRSMEFWEQHKWSGSFPVRWHFIKDVPNSQFRRIILPNNENKSVTNSRDTQEVFYQQGLEMLNIVKNYPLRTSILDEFPLCNMPVKALPDLKPQQHWSPQSFPKIGEQLPKGRSEEPDVNNSPSALKVCDNGAKPTNASKPVAGKVLPPSVMLQDPSSLVKDRQRADKENIKFAGKDGTLASA